MMPLEAYKKPLIVVAVFALLVGGGYWYAHRDYKEIAVIPDAPGGAVPIRMTLKGEYTCIPHRDTSGPQTMECALGLKTGANEYYGLDFNLLSSQVPTELLTGDTLEASGMVTPVEMLSSDHWQKYNMKGILSVTDGVKVTKKTE